MRTLQVKVTVHSSHWSHCDRTRVRAPSCTATCEQVPVVRQMQRNPQCGKRKHCLWKRKNLENGRKMKWNQIKSSLPSHKQMSQEIKSGLRQGLGKRISKLHAGINLLNHDTSVFDCVTKMMPLDPNVFCAWMILIQAVYQFQTSSIVFINCWLPHACVNLWLLCEDCARWNSKVIMSG